MNTREEAYIVALDKFRSITKAAEFLHVSQPTLSIFLNNLEKRLGVTLFERIGKKIIPTKVGEIYIRQANELLTLENRFQRELQPYILGDRGELHVGSTYRGCLPLIPKILAQLHNDYPEVQFCLHDTSASLLESKLADGELDIIYTNQPIKNDQFEVKTLHQDHLVLVLPEGHPACAKAEIIEGMNYPYLDLKHVENEVFYLMEPDHIIRSRVDDAMDYADVHPEKTGLLGHIEIGCQLAAEGLGVAFTMERYIDCITPLRPVRYFRIGDPTLYVNWMIAYRKSDQQPPYVKDFIRLLEQAYE